MKKLQAALRIIIYVISFYDLIVSSLSILIQTSLGPYILKCFRSSSVIVNLLIELWEQLY